VTLPGLLEVRDAIDEVDRKILTLLKERVSLVLRVGEIKRVHAAAVHDPEREKRVIERIKSLTEAPLDSALVERVYTAIIEESRRCEQSHLDKAEL
jgi:chorismate mutase / prephenate dehydratase